MERLSDLGRKPLHNGDSFSAREFLEKGYKMVVFSDFSHRVVTLVGLEGVLYYRDSQGIMRILRDAEVTVADSGGLKLRYHAPSRTLSFRMGKGTAPLNYSCDPVSALEKRLLTNVLSRNGQVEVRAVKSNRNAVAVFVALILSGATVGGVIARTGCVTPGDRTDDGRGD